MYTFEATVNYPDDEQDTPTFKDLSPEGVAELTMKLLSKENEGTSFVIRVTKQ